MRSCTASDFFTYITQSSHCLLSTSGITNDRMCFFFTLFIFFNDYFFIKTILSAVGFISHHHNISCLLYTSRCV